MQSKLDSLIESITNMIAGMIVAVTANYYVLPMFGYDVGLEKSIHIAIVFTVISIIRSYTLRRVYNKIKIFK